jgi:hypothetical protein
MSENRDSPVWQKIEPFAPTVLGPEAVSASTISSTLTILFTGLTVDLQQGETMNGTTLATIRAPIQAPDNRYLGLRGQLRGSFHSHGPACARVTVLFGRASQVFDISGAGADDWTREVSIGLRDRDNAVCTVIANASRESGADGVRLEVDALDLVAELGPERGAGESLY